MCELCVKVCKSWLKCHVAWCFISNHVGCLSQVAVRGRHNAAMELISTRTTALATVHRLVVYGGHDNSELLLLEVTASAETPRLSLVWSTVEETGTQVQSHSLSLILQLLFSYHQV